MAQTVFATFARHGGPLDAAAHFYADHVPKIRELLQDGTLRGLAVSDEIDAVALVFPAAAREHNAWRVAAVQELAREAAPKRVNAVVGDDFDAIRQATDWLASAPGITGQLLAVE
jgi:hypothetical protein